MGAGGVFPRSRGGGGHRAAATALEMAIGAQSAADSETAIMGRLKDGVARVIEAHRTRRVKAQKAKEILQAANVKVLGTVLSERTFPIPEAIYRNL